MIQQMNSYEFIEKIFDYSKDELELKNELPVIIDFYADWCAPCKRMYPILEELSEEYSGKIDFFKVDTMINEELSAVFNIRSLPSIILIKRGCTIRNAIGAWPKSELKEIIDSLFFGINNQKEFNS